MPNVFVKAALMPVKAGILVFDLHLKTDAEIMLATGYLIRNIDSLILCYRTQDVMTNS